MPYNDTVTTDLLCDSIVSLPAKLFYCSKNTGYIISDVVSIVFRKKQKHSRGEYKSFRGMPLWQKANYKPAI